MGERPPGASTVLPLAVVVGNVGKEAGKKEKFQLRIPPGPTP